LTPLKVGETIRQATLDRALLLTADLPGVRTKSNLAPGAEVGTSDLLIKIEPSARISGTAIIDNYGSSNMGSSRIGGSVTIIDPINLKNSDLLTVNALTTGVGMNYSRAGYEAVVNGQGTRVGASLSSLKYILMGSVASSQSEGSAQVASAFVKQPLILKFENTLSAILQYDQLTMKDAVSSIQNDRELHNVTASLTGDTTDYILGGGRNSANFSVTAGQVDFLKIDAQTADASGMNTQGVFSKIAASIYRLQSLGSSTDILVSAYMQVASKNLDTSQKMTLGGASSVRGFDAGVASGDNGYVLSAEYRHVLGLLADGQVTGLAFFDTAGVTINRNAMSQTATNRISLSSVGLGVNWTGSNGTSGKFYFASPIGTIDASLGVTNKPRAWAEVANSF